jgi:hypothetical protein
MTALILIKAELELSTRRNRHIRNEMNREPPLEGARLRIEALRREYPNATHRDDVGPCHTFNCHGLTFGARRTWIDKPADVQKILDDDDYVEIDRRVVKPGDVAIFRKDGEIDHSGVVVDVDNLRRPRVLGKWAFLHEVIHYPWEGPYSDCEVTYYRVRQ